MQAMNAPRGTELRLALAFVEELEGLGSEIEAAMQAIAGNRLPDFEQSVARQESLCRRLRELAIHDPLRKEPISVDVELTSRIRTASSTIRQLNLRYAALLKHSSQSVRLLASLTHGYAARPQPSAGQAKHHSWSCEG